MDLNKLAEELRAVALAYPETYEEEPWGDRVVKVKGKIFFFCGVHDQLLYATVKVPKSGRELLKRDYAEPTHYGMGKHGWVTMKFAHAKDVPKKELTQWIDESFSAVAPKTLLKQLERDKTAQNSKKEPIAKMPEKAPVTKTVAPIKVAKPVKPRNKNSNGKITEVHGAAILVCDDALRADRAVTALGRVGVRCAVVPSVTLEKLGRAKALIVDLGRNAKEGLELAQALDASDRAVHLFVAGVRDAEQARKLRGLGSAETFRAPPGDEAVVSAVAAALSRPLAR